MQNIPAYMSDFEFLKKFDREKIKEQFIKITLLDWNENELEEIEGKVSSGSIQVNGESSLRRSANLTMIPDDKELTQGLLRTKFGLNKKIRISKGFTNRTNQYKEYDKIWFLQGTFVTTSVSISQSISGVSISLTAQDKMCLLNGTCGGVLPGNTNFEYIDDDINGKIYLVYADIIREAVNHYGGEQLAKILISDVPQKIKKVVYWRGDRPLWVEKGEFRNSAPLSYSLVKPNNTTEYNKIKQGDVLGYQYVDFIWTGKNELTVNAGQPVTALLDQLVSALGNYEYFYDIYGNFIFREKKNNLNTTYANEVLENLKNSNYLIDLSKGNTIYDFTDSELIISFNSNPQYNMVKNDFIVFGKVAGKDNSFLKYRLAIDTKPEIGNKYNIVIIDDGIEKKAVSPYECDSRSDFPKKSEPGKYYYIAEDRQTVYTWDSKKGNYVIVKGLKVITIVTKDWRNELYMRDIEAEKLGLAKSDYYMDLKAYWPLVYDIENGKFYSDKIDNQYYFLDFIDSGAAISQFSVSNIGRRIITDTQNTERVNCLFEAELPELVVINEGDGSAQVEDQIEQAKSLNYNYVILDKQVFDSREYIIGDVNKDGKVDLTDESILTKYLSNPNTLLDEYAADVDRNGIINADDLAELKKYLGPNEYTGNVGKSVYEEPVSGGYYSRPAFDVIRNYLYQYTGYNESVSLTTIPIYYLEPNCRISLLNPEIGVEGDYIISSFSLPLDSTGTMNIQARKALEQI